MALAVVPGHGLDFMTLGASLQSILTAIKTDSKAWPSIHLHHSSAAPFASPVIVTLPQNGLRLQFDGADQRLRLIELRDFTKVALAFKGGVLASSETGGVAPFKKIYQMFGASYPGEYVAPQNGAAMGAYVLSWPGLAFTFPVQASAMQTDTKDHLTLLASHVAAPATSAAIFSGPSWPEARKTLFTAAPAGPRESSLAARGHAAPLEFELARIHGQGRVELRMTEPAKPIWLTLNETTPQDLITDLGPPDAVHKASSTPPPAPTTMHVRTGSSSRPVSNGRSSGPSSWSSSNTDTYDTDFDSQDEDDHVPQEWWSYYSYGLDILLGAATEVSPAFPTSNAVRDELRNTELPYTGEQVAIKVTIHGNVPGSHAFNRHRRLRWSLALPAPHRELTSETDWPTVSSTLVPAFKDTWPLDEMTKGKVVNRNWGDAASEEPFFDPDEDKDLTEQGGSAVWLGNTELYAFPGMVFEVMKEGWVCGVSVW